MPDLQSQIQLALDLTGTKTISDAIAELERLGKAAGASAEEIEKSTRVLRYYEEILRGATAAEDDAVRAALELAQAQRAVAQVAEEAVEVRDRQRQAEEELAEVVARNADTIKQGGIEISGLTRGFFDLERAGTALATGHGLARLGPMLERVIGGMGGAAGIGFGIAGLAYAIELVLPKLKEFFGAMDAEKAKKAANELEHLIAKTKEFETLTTSEEDKVNANFRKYVKSQESGAIVRGIRNIKYAEGDVRLSETENKLVAAGYQPAEIDAEMKVHTAAQRKYDEEQTARIAGKFMTDPAARAEVARMAQARPELFPVGLAENISRIEWGGEFKTPEETAKQKLKDEAAERSAQKEIHASQKKETDRIKADIERRHKIAEDDKKKQKQEAEELVAGDTLGRKYAREVDEKAARDQKHADEKAARETEHAKKKAEREAEHATKKAEHAASLPGRVQAEHQFVGQQVVAADQANRAQGGTPATPGFLQHVTQQAIANVDTGQTLANAIHNAVQQTKEKIEADAARHLKEMSRQMDASQGHTATKYNRG